MQDDGFTPKELEQLQGLIPTIDQIQAVVREEIQSPETRAVIRQEVGKEIDRTVTPRLVVIEKKINAMDAKIDVLATKDQEDSDALTSTYVDLAERVETLEKIHKVELAEVR